MQFKKDGEIKSLDQLKADYPNISFAEGTPAELGWELYTPPTPEPVAPDYRTQRMMAYLPIGEQMDMQYWDSVNGTTTWADHIAAVKAQYPKP